MFFTPPPVIVPQEVAAVEYSIKRYLSVLPNDAALTKQDYLFQPDSGINATTAWDTVKGNHTVVVAVIDSGVDLSHSDLAPNIWHNPNEIAANTIDDDNNGYSDDVSGWDFVDDDNSPTPSVGVGSALVLNHGTHVAGIIGASGNNSLGITGIAWHVQLMPLRVFAADGSSDIAHITAAINYAIANGADIINMSYAGATPSTLEEAALERAHAAGIITVAAAGNRSGNDSGNLDETPVYPACYSHVLGIAALDRHNQRANFSNYGQACVDMAAPGKNIYSTVFGNTFDYFSGTSMAAPQVSGTIALLLSSNPRFTPTQIHRFLTTAATPLADHTLGAGELNVAATLEKSRLDSTVPQTPKITAYCLKQRRHCLVPRRKTNQHHRPYFTWSVAPSDRPIVGYYVAWGTTLQDPVTHGQLQTTRHWQPTRLPDQTTHYYLMVRALNDRGEISPRAVFDYFFVPHLRDP